MLDGFGAALLIGAVACFVAGAALVGLIWWIWG